MVAAVATMASALLPSFLTGAVAVPMGDELDYSEVGLGVAVAVFFLLAALTSPHAGALVDRLGPRRSLRLACTLSGTSLLATAWLVHGLVALTLAMAVGAIGLTLAGPGTKVMVARGVPVRHHGLAFGVQAGAVPLSSLLCGVAVSTIVGGAGWRWAYVAALAVPLIGFVLAPPTPVGASATAGRTGDAERPALGEGRRGIGSRPVSSPKVDLRRPSIDYGPLLALGAAVTLGAAAATSVAAFFVPAAVRLDITATTAGALLAASSAVVIAVRVISGIAIDRSGRDPLAAVTAMMAISTLGYALAASRSPVLMPIGALVALGAGWSWSGLVVHAVVRHYHDTPGAATGIISGAQNVGGVVGPLTFGLVADLGSYTMAFLLAAASAAAAAAVSAAGRRKLRAPTVEPDRPTPIGPLADLR